jgi:two-component system cell cycle sensor histidine kinase PleC
MDSGLAPAEMGQALRRVVLLVDRNWRVRETLEERGAIKLDASLAPGASLIALVHADDADLLHHNRNWCAQHEDREVALRIRYRRGTDWWLPLLTTLRCRSQLGTEVTLELDSAVAARASEQQMRKVIDGSQQGIVVTTLEKPLYVNNGFARLIGYENVQEMLADQRTPFADSIHPDDLPTVMKHLRKRLSGEVKFSQYELRIRRRDGSYVWVETMASLVNWDGHPASLSWLIDIEARKKAEADLIASREAAERANRVKSDFLASMSHELRTPLNAILGFSEMISSQMLGSINPRYVAYARDIYRSGQLLLELINDILDLSKLEAGKLTLKESEVNLPDLVRNCVALIRGQAEEKGLSLLEDLPSEIPHVRADARALKQVILNFLSNAIKFTPPGGCVATGAAFDPRRGVEFSVTDTGIGMSAAEVEVAMEPFGQIDSMLARDHPGTGLGLPISLALMKLHGGEIAIDSVPGEGTRLRAWIPPDRLIARAAA